MNNIIYVLVVGLAIVLSMKAAAAVLLTLLPLALIALVLALPVGAVMLVGWLVTRAFRGPGGVERRGARAGGAAA